MIRQRRTINEMGGFFRRLEWIVGGEHHPVWAERADGAGQRLRRAHARRRHHEVLFDVLRRRLGKLDAVELGTAVEPPYQIRQCLSEMAENEFAARKPV